MSGKPGVVLERKADDVWILHLQGSPNGSGSFQNTFNPGDSTTSLLSII